MRMHIILGLILFSGLILGYGYFVFGIGYTSDSSDNSKSIEDEPLKEWILLGNTESVYLVSNYQIIQIIDETGELPLSLDATFKIWNVIGDTGIYSDNLILIPVVSVGTLVNLNKESIYQNPLSLILDQFGKSAWDKKLHQSCSTSSCLLK